MIYKTGQIYLLTNKTNGKKYVGQSVRGAARIREHLFAAEAGVEYPLYRAIRKYGWDDFEVSFIWEGPAEELDDQERKFIKEYDSLSPQGYNLTTGGNSGKEVSEESRKRMSDFRIARWGDPEYRDYMLMLLAAPKYKEAQSVASTERWKDEEYRAATTLAIQEAVRTPEHREKMTEIGKEFWGRPGYREKVLKSRENSAKNSDRIKNHSETMKKKWEDRDFREKTLQVLRASTDTPEMRALRAENTKELWLTPEHREKAVRGMKITASDPNEKERKSEASKKIWENPERRNKHTETMKKMWDNPEYRAIMAEAQRKRWEKQRMQNGNSIREISTCSIG